MKTLFWLGAAAVGLSAASAGGAADTPRTNPFATPSSLPFQAPPFDRIKDSDYQPALEQGMAIQLAEMNRIASNPAAPTFDNTIAAMEKSGRMLERAELAFYGVVQANTNDTLDAVQTAEAPKFAAHNDAIFLNPKLFARVKALHDILQCYITTAEQLTQALADACAEDKWDDASRLAQDIVGAAGGLGLAAVTQAARHFTQATRAGENPHELRNAAQMVLGEHIRTKQALTHLYPDVM